MCKGIYVCKRSNGLPAAHEENQNCVQSTLPKKQSWHGHAWSGMHLEFWGFQATLQPCTLLWV